MRPRAVKPNTLQIPRYVTDYIKTAFKKCESYLNIKVTKNEDKSETYDYSEYDHSRFEYIKEELKAQYNITEDITIENFRPLGLRNCFRAPEDYYFVSCDLKTAEVFAIGYLAGDKNLINALTQPDPQFAFKRMPDGTKKQVRIAYIDEIVKLTDEAKDPALLTDPNDPDLIRDENGELIHPKQDIHWQNCENYLAFNTPREKLDKNKTRDAAGKAASFSIPYGASPQLLERTIKIATGEDPEPGTGQRLIDAYMNSKPDVAKFLDERKREVIEKQYYKSPSGYKRHYILPDEDSDLPKKAKEALISSLQRQNCNIGLQELVAATLSIATVSLMKEFRKQNMKARVICPLYDAIYVIAPFYEVREVHRLLKKCFSEDIGWDLPGGTLHFQTDHETGPSWGEHLTELEEIKLNEKIEKYTQNQTANK